MRLRLTTIYIVRLEELDRQHRDILDACHAMRLNAYQTQILGIGRTVLRLMAKHRKCLTLESLVAVDTKYVVVASHRTKIQI